MLFTAFQLKKIIDVIHYEINEYSLNVFTINYEDFVNNPDKVLEKSLNYCELGYDKSCFDYIKKNEIVNKNKPYKEYFDKDTLFKLEKLFGPDIIFDLNDEK